MSVQVSFRVLSRFVGLGVMAAGLSACDTGIGVDGFNLAQTDPTSKTAPRPEPDSRGVISYPNYQVVVARSGDTVSDVAARIGLGARELAGHNGLSVDTELRAGELLALPKRVKTSGLDIESIATSAIDDAEGKNSTSGVEPIRHRVEKGETAYSIARLYDVSVTSLAKWNGLGTDLAIRDGQTLLIPVVETPVKRTVDASKPGSTSTTPTPPSAKKPLPKDVEKVEEPASPDLKKDKTKESRTFLMPVSGDIISGYSGKSGGNEGIDIAALPGTTVKAAEDGEVALVSKSVGSSTIVLLRHADNIYTVYSNVVDVSLKKGERVRRGQPVGKVAQGSPSYLHFEVRRGTESVDPTPFL